MTSELKIVLASSSPRRKHLLEQIGLDFKVHTPSWDEVDTVSNPRLRVMENALRKAQSVMDEVDADIIIGADTVVYIDGTILGKPNDRQDAFRMLQKLSGKVHRVFTGLAVLSRGSGTPVVRSEMTLVHFKHLTDDEINAYIESGEPMDKAGGYGVQGLGAVFVDRIIGNYDNVVGLPVSLLYDILRELNYSLLSTFFRD